MGLRGSSQGLSPELPAAPAVTSPTAPSSAPFPPRTIEAFLTCCAGDWLSLRSRFSLQVAATSPEGDDDSWHRSERGELKVTYLAPERQGEPGSLEITPPVSGEDTPGGVTRCRQLLFTADGHFRGHAPSGAETLGSWRLWPDGSLELTSCDGQTTVKERIWFTKPNLRLRSSVEHGHDGSPGRASFSSEIRRLSRPSA
jgi:hypothetical protein